MNLKQFNSVARGLLPQVEAIVARNEQVTARLPEEPALTRLERLRIRTGEFQASDIPDLRHVETIEGVEDSDTPSVQHIETIDRGGEPQIPSTDHLEMMEEDGDSDTSSTQPVEMMEVDGQSEILSTEPDDTTEEGRISDTSSRDHDETMEQDLDSEIPNPQPLEMIESVAEELSRLSFQDLQLREGVDMSPGND